MKAITIFFTVLIASVFNANAQIPNSGFEDWDSYPNYLDPVDYLSPNPYATTSFYPVTRSMDHYPSDVGSYSIRIENNTALPFPNVDGLGIVLQNATSLADGPYPYFPITGHPQSLTGYYKYFPENGDSLRIICILYHNGTSVSGEAFVSGDTASEWTSFTISLPSYVVADSGSILLAAYNANGHPPTYVPHGNSVLYVDNLNFDNLITSTTNINKEMNIFSLYPNPASGYVFLNSDLKNDQEITLNIFNVIGGKVKTEKLKSNCEKINVGDLNCGMYLIEITSKGNSEMMKLIIQ